MLPTKKSVFTLNSILFVLEKTVFSLFWCDFFLFSFQIRKIPSTIHLNSMNQLKILIQTWLHFWACVQELYQARTQSQKSMFAMKFARKRRKEVSFMVAWVMVFYISIVFYIFCIFFFQAELWLQLDIWHWMKVAAMSPWMMLSMNRVHVALTVN